MISACAGASSGSGGSAGVSCNVVRHCVSLSSSRGRRACFNHTKRSFSVWPSSSGKRNFSGSSLSGPVFFGNRKPKGCDSGSLGRSSAGPDSPLSVSSLSNSVTMSLMIRLTACPCCGTSPFTEMCNRQSMGSARSASLPLTPKPRKNTRAPLSVSIFLWCMPPRPIMRLRMFAPYMPFVSKVSRKIFSDHGYLFSGIAGGGSFGIFGTT
mmetsp:Transcript_102880/g.178469  ORF Transcript_102880/g.178469 Transcript_102880/m.178469 type:complete len:210 (+) Transcript_102880:1490-2119(+)